MGGAAAPYLVWCCWVVQVDLVARGCFPGGLWVGTVDQPWLGPPQAASMSKSLFGAGDGLTGQELPAPGNALQLWQQGFPVWEGQ